MEGETGGLVLAHLWPCKAVHWINQTNEYTAEMTEQFASSMVADMGTAKTVGRGRLHLQQLQPVEHREHSC